jgi:hypothetical protein
MKHVFSNDEIPHLWAHQTQPEARNANHSFYFEGDTIYSYRSSFPIARHVVNSRGERAVLLTTRRYSITTSRHHSRVRSAIPHSTRVFHVSYVDNDPAHILEREFPADIRAALERAATANRRNRPKHLATATEELHLAQQFAEFFDLDASKLPPIPDAESVARVVSEWQAAERAAAEARAAQVRGCCRKSAAESYPPFPRWRQSVCARAFERRIGRTPHRWRRSSHIPRRALSRRTCTQGTTPHPRCHVPWRGVAHKRPYPTPRPLLD